MRIISGLALSTITGLMMTNAALAGGCYNGPCYEKVVTPATYGVVAEQVMVRPASVRRVVSPAQYTTVAEPVVVRPERTVARRIPAVTNTVAEQVLVSSGGRRWQVTRDAYGREVGCWVDTPPVYATQYRTVVVQPASVVYETIPAVTRMRSRSVMVQPAQVREDVSPPVYRVQQRTVMTSPATAAWQPLR